VSNIPVPRLLTFTLPLVPGNLGPVPRPITPELQHIVSRAVTPETEAANHLANYSGLALPRLDTLASLADQAPPSTPPHGLGPNLVSDQLLPPLSPFPTHDPRLGPLPDSFDPEDLTYCNDWDLPGSYDYEDDDDDAPNVRNLIRSPPSLPPSNALGLIFEPARLLPPLHPLPPDVLQLGPTPTRLASEAPTWRTANISHLEEEIDNVPLAS
jgi:hypothetical protein